MFTWLSRHLNYQDSYRVESVVKWVDFDSDTEEGLWILLEHEILTECGYRPSYLLHVRVVKEVRLH